MNYNYYSFCSPNETIDTNLSHLYTGSFISTCPFNTHILCSVDDMLLAFDNLSLCVYDDNLFTIVPLEPPPPTRVNSPTNVIDF